LITVVEEALEVVTRPLATTSVKSGSCTSMTSPGLSIAALIPVENVTTSFSKSSVNNWYLPCLTACPCEVHPKAEIFFLLIFPVLAILSWSSTTSTACLYPLSGSLQVTAIWLFLNLPATPE